MIDAHQHLWDTAVRDYAWMDGPWADPLRGRFDVTRYAEAAEPFGVEGSIVVQALHSAEETRELLAIADARPIEGVVGWIDLTAADVADVIAGLSGPLVGIRHQVQDEPDPGWLCREDVRRGLRAVGEAGLVYDLLVKPPQADAALETVRALPEVSFVLDHAGKPDIAGGVWEPWASWIASLAALPNVAVKVSGLVTEAAADWKPADILPYAAHVLEAFRPERVMFGSDWPVCTLAAPYGTVVDLAAAAVDGLSNDERSEVFGGTACRVYGIGG
ncbi:amidohydrolase family protein [Actinomadura barringtoniae]|uniref:Amidohydrolase family protein n=1 Tax=Actinomadura barringtoniae TaxID=1427535 RepID=A0A939PFF0_9ACTN|nr:amidohydrolase family protein [Actinomadura barringtoniae]MBO2451857.1 amidohydrolase family protein [Actinomadura barringtoniae]